MIRYPQKTTASSATMPSEESRALFASARRTEKLSRVIGAPETEGEGRSSDRPEGRPVSNLIIHVADQRGGKSLYAAHRPVHGLFGHTDQPVPNTKRVSKLPYRADPSRNPAACLFSLRCQPLTCFGGPFHGFVGAVPLGPHGGRAASRPKFIPPSYIRANSLENLPSLFFMSVRPNPGGKARAA